MQYCVLMYENGKYLYGVFGPFDSRHEAEEWAPKNREEALMERQVLRLFSKYEPGEEQHR